MSVSREIDGDKNEFDISVDNSKNTSDNDEAKPSPSCKLYVTNLPHEYRSEDLKDLFRSQVDDVRFARVFDESDRLEGSGVVEFADRAAVVKGIEKMQGFDLKGRLLTITEHMPEVEEERPRKRAGVDQNTDTSRGTGGANLSHRVYVSNLPNQLGWQDVKDLFREEVGEVRSAKVKRSMGCGIVQFCNREMVEKCLEKMHGFDVMGQKLTITENTADISNNEEEPSKRANLDRSTTETSRNGTGGKFLNRVYVSNLPDQFGWQDLKDLFRNEVGEVVFVRMKKRKGCGTVEFGDHEMVEKCLKKMHGFDVKGRQLSVTEDTSDMPEVNNKKESRKRAKVDRNTDTSRDADGASLLHRVSVSNLPHEFRWQDLKDLFRDEVGEVVFAKMKKSKGCGIVEFCDREMVQKCLLKMHGFDLKGRQLTVTDDTSDTSEVNNDEKPKKRAKVDQNTDTSRDGDDASSSHRVYVSNLPFEFRWQDLKDLFRDKVGEVLFANMLPDEVNKPKGCGIVEFSDRETVEKCLRKMHGFEVNGRKLTVTDDTGDIPDKEERPRKRARLDRRHTSRDRGDASLSNRVYVSNLPYEFQWQDLKDLFRDEVGEVLYTKILVDDMNKSKGCGIVEFSDRDMVEKCVEKMHGFRVKGHKLIIKDDGDNMRDRHMSGDVNDNRFGRSQKDFGDRGNDRSGNTYGLTRAFLQALNINVPLSKRVFVGNLDYKVDKNKLKEVFRLAGRVVRVELQAYKDGRSKGYAVVEYDHPVEAVQAISMLHDQFLFDRPMTVRMDQEVKRLPEGLRNVGEGLGLNGECLKDVVHNLPSLSTGRNQQSAPNPAPQLSDFVTSINTFATNATLRSLISCQSTLQATLSGLTGPGSSIGVAKDLLQETRDTLNNLNQVLTSGLLSQSAPFTANQNVGSRPQSNFDQSDSLAFEPVNPLNREVSADLGTNSHFPSNNQFAYEHSSQSRPSYQNVNVDSDRNSDFVSSQTMSKYAKESPPFESNTRHSPQIASRNYFETKYHNRRVPHDTDFNSDLETSVNSFGSRAGGCDLGSKNRRQMNSNMSQTNSKKLLIKHIPRTIGYTTLFNRFSEFGEVQHLEREDNSDILVVYSSNCEAENAVECLHLTYVDGNTIEASLC